MALAARLVSRSRLLCSSRAALVNGGANQVRSYAKEAAPADQPPANVDDFLKGIFSFWVMKKFRAALDIVEKEKITVDPDDPATLYRFAQAMKPVREMPDILSDSQTIKYVIENFAMGIPDARTYLNTLQEISIKGGLINRLGIEPLMMEALDKVEKDIKKPLLRSDKKNMGTLLAEFDKIYKKEKFKDEVPGVTNLDIRNFL